MNSVEKNPPINELNFLIGLLNNNIEEADLYLQKLIKKFCYSPVLYNLQGVILSRKNEIQPSINAFKNAISLEKNFVDAYYNLALILKNISHEESLINFKKVIDLDPKHINALMHLGSIYAVQKDFSKAKFFFEQVVLHDPFSINGLNNLGNVLFELNLFDQAKKIFIKAISLDQNMPFSHNNLSKVLIEQNLLDEAEISINKALLLKPDYFEAYNNLGLVYFEKNKFKESIDQCLKSIQINPEFAYSHCNLGDCYRELRMFDLAIKSHKKSIELDKLFVGGYNSLGLDYLAQFQYDKAIEQFTKAININKDYYRAYSNLANVYYELQDLETSKFFYEKSVTLKKDFYEGYYNAASLYLLQNEFKKGWELYNFRWNIKKSPVQCYDINKNHWDGNFLNGILLVWSEQGVGDNIFYGSMVSKLKNFAKEIIFETDQRLINLFKRFFLNNNIENIKVKNFNENQPTSFDKHIPLGTLGKFFINNLKDFESLPKEYLVADKQRKLYFNQKLLNFNKELKIGLSWKTGNIKEQHRNINLKDLYPILSDKRFCFFNLQFGETTKETQDFFLETSVDIKNLENLDNFNNLEDLAALIDNLDLVITIQNSTAHLCGALGKKTFLLLPKNHRWHWGLNQKISLWYPSIKIFRQQTFNNWNNVVEDVRNEVLKLL